jgi:hypothetical protein
VEYFDAPRSLPSELTARYPWMPPDVRELAETARNACGPDEKAWFLTVLDYSNESGSAFAWNEWEQQSLDAAEAAEKAVITNFWNEYLPILRPSSASSSVYRPAGLDHIILVIGRK